VKVLHAHTHAHTETLVLAEGLGTRLGDSLHLKYHEIHTPLKFRINTVILFLTIIIMVKSEYHPRLDIGTKRNCWLSNQSSFLLWQCKHNNIWRRQL